MAGLGAAAGARSGSQRLRVGAGAELWPGPGVESGCQLWPGTGAGAELGAEQGWMELPPCPLVGAGMGPAVLPPDVPLCAHTPGRYSPQFGDHCLRN